MGDVTTFNIFVKASNALQAGASVNLRRVFALALCTAVICPPASAKDCAAGETVSVMGILSNKPIPTGERGEVTLLPDLGAIYSCGRSAELVSTKPLPPSCKALPILFRARGNANRQEGLTLQDITCY